MKPLDLPFSIEQISDLLQSSIHSLEPVTVGCSPVSVYRLKGDQTSYLKIVGVDRREDLGREAEIIRWLSMYTNVPEVLFFEVKSG